MMKVLFIPIVSLLAIHLFGESQNKTENNQSSGFPNPVNLSLEGWPIEWDPKIAKGTNALFREIRGD